MVNRKIQFLASNVELHIIRRIVRTLKCGVMADIHQLPARSRVGTQVFPYSRNNDIGWGLIAFNSLADYGSCRARLSRTREAKGILNSRRRSVSICGSSERLWRASTDRTLGEPCVHSRQWSLNLRQCAAQCPRKTGRNHGLALHDDLILSAPLGLV